MPLTDANLRQLPKPIVDKLRQLIRRARRVIFLRGLFATLAVALLCILAIMAIDATVTLFSDALRWTLSLTGLAITALAAWFFLLRPLSRRLGLTRIARIIETRHPELQERISTAVELMSTDDPDSIRGSTELIGEVVDSAVIDVEDVNPEAEFKGRRTRRPMLITAIVAGVLLLLFAIFPRHISVLFARAVAPFLDIGNAYANTLKVDPGDIRVAIGDPVTVEISIQNDKIRRAELRKSTLLDTDAPTPDGKAENKLNRARGEETVERMTLREEKEDGTQIYRLTFNSVQESFDYRIRAGAALSEYFSVTAVPTPKIEQLTIAYEHPGYTGLRDREFVTETGDIRALANTRVTVTAQLNKAVETADLQVGDEQEKPAEARLDGTTATWSFDLAPGTNAMWQIALTDSDGFTNTPLNYQMVALEDQVPTIEIVAPEERQLKLKPTEYLPIYYLAEEDFGFRKARLVVQTGTDSEPRLIDLNLPEPAAMEVDKRRVGGLWSNIKKYLMPRSRDGSVNGMPGGETPRSTSSALDLDGVSQLTARVVVLEDNLPEELNGGPNVG